MCMKGQSLFSGENKENIINVFCLQSAVIHKADLTGIQVTEKKKKKNHWYIFFLFFLLPAVHIQNIGLSWYMFILINPCHAESIKLPRPFLPAANQIS